MVLIARAFRQRESKRQNFREWIGRISDLDMNAVEAFVIGDCNEREALSRLIRERSTAPVLCLNERHSLDDTLCLFAAGADDVLRKPVHVREIVARVGAINRRVFGEKGNVTIGELRVYFDGRDSLLAYGADWSRSRRTICSRSKRKCRSRSAKT